jgi:ribosomal protein L15
VDQIPGCLPIIKKQIMNDFEKGKSKIPYSGQRKVLKFGKRDKKMPLYPIFGKDECFRLYILIEKRRKEEMANLSLEELKLAREKELKINIEIYGECQ